MNANLAGTLYKRIIDASNGVSKVKIDLHVHTPASHDFKVLSKCEDDTYVTLLNEALESGIQIIAITDHNTFRGYDHIRRMIESNVPAYKPFSGLLILCGIEITCFSKHLLAIFPDAFSEDAQRAFLRDIGVDESVEGTEDALADNLGPSPLIDKIGEYGGFAILAHADAKHGFLCSLCSKDSGSELSFIGKSLAKIIRNKNLFGVQCNNESKRQNIQSKLKNVDYLRKEAPLAFIKCSDCHGIVYQNEYTGSSGQAIGTVYSVKNCLKYHSTH
ncbi:MAG: PHP domain-containing protein [Eubacteriales bacterium]|nr:PHP domain-containing protein [Eubacteriales bacterium]